jgi:RimJ/RimL family protein N-acetyltransferase
LARQRFVLAAPVVRRAVAADPQARPPTPADAPVLAALMLQAYRGTLDDEGETLADSLVAVQQLFAGEFGAMDWAGSELVEREGRLVSATLLTTWEERPFVAFMLTAPEAQGQGLARAGLTRAMNRLAARGETVLRLVVTQGNTRAEALYERLGFRPEAQLPFTTA